MLTATARENLPKLAARAHGVQPATGPRASAVPPRAAAQVDRAPAVAPGADQAEENHELARPAATGRPGL
jgi:hypothetical protein